MNIDRVSKWRCMGTMRDMAEHISLLRKHCSRDICEEVRVCMRQTGGRLMENVRR